MAEPAASALREFQLYIQRVGDRWPIERALAGGARLSPGEPGAAEEPDYLIVLVSDGFDGVPWLERVRQAEALWDAAEMGGRPEVHCYTPIELERKVAQLPRVRDTVEHGLDLLA